MMFAAKCVNAPLCRIDDPVCHNGTFVNNNLDLCCR